MGSTMEDLMRRRAKEKADAYEAQWNGGLGSHHPDYDPTYSGPDAVKASRATEEVGWLGDVLCERLSQRGCACMCRMPITALCLVLIGSGHAVHTNGTVARCTKLAVHAPNIPAAHAARMPLITHRAAGLSAHIGCANVPILFAQLPLLLSQLYNAIVRDDVAAVYDKIEEGADVNFVFGPIYRCIGGTGYTPLMVGPADAAVWVCNSSCLAIQLYLALLLSKLLFVPAGSAVWCCCAIACFFMICCICHATASQEGLAFAQQPHRQISPCT